METCKDYDLLWIQSIPSIAAIYYYKNLSSSHILYCPDNDNKTQQARHIAKSILNVINSNDKKLAIYFINPCTEEKRETIFKFLMKSRPELSSYCISIPTTLLQTNLLLGWSAETNDTLWQKRCAVELNPDVFDVFTPPTQKSGQSECLEYLNEFAISNKTFSKKSLIVDLSRDVVFFDHKKGIQFKYCLDHCIRGWMRATDSKPRTLIWIIDEKSLFGEHLNNVIQDKRSVLLKAYRDKLFSSIEAFATTTPIYCYLVNFFTTAPFNLTNYIAQIQHRHHLCLSKSILLKQRHDEELRQGYLSKIKVVYHNAFPAYTDSKWQSMFIQYFSEMKRNGYDEIDYISSDILNIDYTTVNYISPLLEEDREKKSLTDFENIGNNESLHTVSAQSFEVFDKWVNLLKEAAVKDIDTGNSENSTLFDKVLASLTTQKIKDYIGNHTVFEQGMTTLTSLFDMQYTLLKTKKLSLSAKVRGPSETPYIVSLEFNRYKNIIFASCSCLLGSSGHCKHCAAILKCFLENPQDFKLSPSQKLESTESSGSSSDSSSAKKRSFNESQDEDSTDTEDNKNKKNKSGESNSLYTEASLSEQDRDNRKPKEIIEGEDGSFKQLYSTAQSITTSSVENNSNSFSSTSMPSIHSSLYCSASSKSLESITSFPTVPSSGSLGVNTSDSSVRGPSYPQSSDDATLPYSNTEEESSQTQEYTVDDESRGDNNYRTAQGTSEDATQYYNPDETEDGEETQYYDPNDTGEVEDKSTQLYKVENKIIVLDDSDEDATQPYDANEIPTQYYNPEDLSHTSNDEETLPYHSDEEQITQPYDPDMLPTQYYKSEVGSNSSNDIKDEITQSYDPETAPTQFYSSETRDNINVARVGSLTPKENESATENKREYSHSPSSPPSESNSPREWLSDLL